MDGDETVSLEGSSRYCLGRGAQEAQESLLSSNGVRGW